MRQIDIEEFPALLTEINDVPKKLYLAGELPRLGNKILCVVGSRKYSSYGKEACEKLILGLVGMPVTIVSGLALGIDAIAHRAALSAGLQTIALPGSGLDPRALYPSTNMRLAEEIISAGGGLLSEFEPDFHATQWSFPQRNRIMAGMSHATLIIEAEIQSGTLITSKLATEYNRDVLTVPGSIFSLTTEGPHMLLRLGATPVRSSDDILEILGLKKTEEVIVRNYDDCSDEEKIIIKLLIEPMPRDELIRASKLSIQTANAVLGILEIKGLLRESMGEIHLA